MTVYKTTEIFKWKLKCTECEYSIDIDEYETVECMFENMSRHVVKFNHPKYELEIYDIDKESLKLKKDIVTAFVDIDDAIPLTDVIDKLKDLEYDEIGTIIIDAIQCSLLYIDSIEDDGAIYIALTESGEELWEIYHSSSEQEKDMEKDMPSFF